MSLALNYADAETVTTDLEKIVEHVWADLSGRVSHNRIREVAQNVAADLADAQVTLFVPMLIRRCTREALLPEAMRH